MSADNWAICPKCMQKQIEEHEQLKRQVGESYGVVPVEQYLQLRRKLEIPVKFEYTLREDYEIGVYEDGEFSISYKGYCDKCKFNYEYKHKEQVYIP